MMIAVRNEIWFIAQLEEKKKYPFYYDFCIVDIVDNVMMLWQRLELSVCVVANVSAGEEECCDVLHWGRSTWHCVTHVSITSRHNHTEFLTDIDGSSVQPDKAKMLVSGRFPSGQPSLKTEASHPDWKYLLLSNHLAGLAGRARRKLGFVKSPNLSLPEKTTNIYYYKLQRMLL